LKFTIFNVFIFCFSVTSSLLGAETLTVVHNGCEHLDVTEIGRLTEFELSQSLESKPYKIFLNCRGDSLQIFVYSKIGQPPLDRSIKLNDSSLKERIVSLTVSQLVTTAGASQAKPKSRRDGRHPAPQTATKPRSDKTRLTNTEPSPSPSSAAPDVQIEDSGVEHVVISVGGGVKPHCEFSLPLGYVLIRSGFWFRSKWGVISTISFEGGLAERAPGNVTAMSGLVGLGAAWRVWGAQFFHLDLSGIGSVGYTYLKGSPQEDARGDELGGIAGEFVIGLGGVFEAKNWILALDLLGGYTIKNPIGTVIADDSVTLGGFWLGGGLRIGAMTNN